MKKILLFMLVILLALSLSSCSKEDDPAPVSSVSLKVGGVIKTYNNVHVEQIPYTDGSGLVDLFITANNADSTESVTFYVGKGDVGTFHWDFSYTINGIPFYEVENSINTNATTNSDNKLIGTFSGSVTSSESATLELTQGSFYITY